MPRTHAALALALALALASSLSLGCACASTPRGTTENLELLKSTKVDVSDAIKTAFAKATGRVLDTELRDKKGKTVWEVDVAGSDGKVVEVDVDASSGQVVDSE